MKIYNEISLQSIHLKIIKGKLIPITGYGDP
jgi:hypothetical protein